MKKFGNIKEKDFIIRVYGYKAESAKVMKVETVLGGKLKFTVKGYETKKKSVFLAEKNSTGIGLTTGEAFYPDVEMMGYLRDGIMIGMEYSRKLMMNSFKSNIPYFTVNGRPAEDMEEMNSMMKRYNNEQ